MVGGGRRARGVKGGEGRDVSPVPPTMAMDIGSRNYQWSLDGEGREIYRCRLLGGRTSWGRGVGILGGVGCRVLGEEDGKVLIQFSIMNMAW